MLPLLRCFFAHLLILQYPDHHQNLISSSLYYSGPVHKISSQSVHNFLSNVVHRQTNKQTDRQTNQRYQKHNPLCQGGNKPMVQKHNLLCQGGNKMQNVMTPWITLHFILFHQQSYQVMKAETGMRKWKSQVLQLSISHPKRLVTSLIPPIYNNITTCSTNCHTIYGWCITVISMLCVIISGDVAKEMTTNAERWRIQNFININRQIVIL